MLSEAQLPAMTTAPNEFMNAWITTLEIEKSTPCSPAGIPILSIFIRFFTSMRALAGVKRSAPLSRSRQRSTRAAEIHCAMTVAIATPATSR